MWITLKRGMASANEKFVFFDITLAHLAMCWDKKQKLNSKA